MAAIIGYQLAAGIRKCPVATNKRVRVIGNILLASLPGKKKILYVERDPRSTLNLYAASLQRPRQHGGRNMSSPEVLSPVLSHIVVDGDLISETSPTLIRYASLVFYNA